MKQRFASAPTESLPNGCTLVLPTQRISELENKLLRRDILSEYGLKPDAEEFLGDGTAEEMRARADKLKGGFAHQDIIVPEKTSGEPKSRTQEEYGLDVKI